jgi:hypothetical protein
MRDTQPLLDYIATSSEAALESMELARLNQASNFRKQLREILDDWIDAEVDAKMVRWVLECRRAQDSDPVVQKHLPEQAPTQQLALPFVASRASSTRTLKDKSVRELPERVPSIDCGEAPPSSSRTTAPPPEAHRSVGSSGAYAALRVLEQFARANREAVPPLRSDDNAQNDTGKTQNARLRLTATNKGPDKTQDKTQDTAEDKTSADAAQDVESQTPRKHRTTPLQYPRGRAPAWTSFRPVSSGSHQIAPV